MSFEFVYWQLLNLHSVNLRIQSEYRKIRPEKTPHLDTFHVVLFKWSQVLVFSRLHQWRIIDINVAEDTINFFFVVFSYGASTHMWIKFPRSNYTVGRAILFSMEIFGTNFSGRHSSWRQIFSGQYSVFWI